MKNLTNVALGKPVNGLGSNVSAVTDGITSAGVHWDGGCAPASVTVDLGGYFRISSLTLVTYYGDQRCYHFIAQASTDGKNYETLATQEEDIPVSADGYHLSFAETTARYVKVTMTYNSYNPSVHIAELAVYGEEDLDFVAPAADAADCDPDDLAFGKPTHAGANDAFSMLVTDGNPNTCWIGDRYPCHVDVDLEKNCLFPKG